MTCTWKVSLKQRVKEILLPCPKKNCFFDS
jgi:hypothetical protein